jgi:hypothetical protein
MGGVGASGAPFARSAGTGPPRPAAQASGTPCIAAGTPCVAARTGCTAAPARRAETTATPGAGPLAACRLGRRRRRASREHACGEPRWRAQRALGSAGRRLVPGGGSPGNCAAVVGARPGERGDTAALGVSSAPGVSRPAASTGAVASGGGARHRDRRRDVRARRGCTDWDRDQRPSARRRRQDRASTQSPRHRASRGATRAGQYRGRHRGVPTHGDAGQGSLGRRRGRAAPLRPGRLHQRIRLHQLCRLCRLGQHLDRRPELTGAHPELPDTLLGLVLRVELLDVRLGGRLERPGRPFESLERERILEPASQLTP